eukprot:TRINITY_DN3619_c1_g1_i3.p1 TRINITY_DN3619_c1_g1~~TRINITY_DN3619_c1_g1_i3.p1  ORF type:complete len:373 (+),score=49.47 TRINITY_DN3619_c1_g1_i3:133-1251(+)
MTLNTTLFFCLISISLAQNCTTTKQCVTKEGAKCSGTFGVNCDPGNPEANCCPQFSYCVESACVIDNYGKKCTQKDDCLPDQIGTGLYDCIHGQCTAIFNQGDKCTTDANCYGGMSCSDGICKGIAKGQPCKAEIGYKDGFTGFSCEFGLYCSSQGVCIEELKDGDNCTSSIQCGLGSLCNPGTGVCVAKFSLDKDQSCIEGLCSIGTVCENGKCIEGEDYAKPIVCYNDKDCANGHCSDCNEFTGTQICISNDKKPATNCKTEDQTLLECFKEYKCHDTFAYQSGTCQHDYCLTEMQASWYCHMCIDDDSLGTCFGRFDINGHCIIPLPYWLVLSIVGGSTVLLLLLLLLVCKIGDACRRTENKKEYKSIN